MTRTDSYNPLSKGKKPRKHWIDCLRGFCCLIVIVDHAEVYLTGERITNYSWYSTNALVTFFFLSGYLAYKATGFDYKRCAITSAIAWLIYHYCPILVGKKKSHVADL